MVRIVSSNYLPGTIALRVGTNFLHFMEEMSNISVASFHPSNQEKKTHKDKKIRDEAVGAKYQDLGNKGP